MFSVLFLLCVTPAHFNLLVFPSKAEELLQAVKSRRCTADSEPTPNVQTSFWRVTYQRGQDTPDTLQMAVHLPDLQKTSGEKGRGVAKSPTELQQLEGQPRPPGFLLMTVQGAGLVHTRACSLDTTCKPL